jgi:hypothetical protein
MNMAMTNHNDHTGFVRRLAEGIGFGLAVVAVVVLGLAVLARQQGLHEIRSTESENPARADATINMRPADESLGGTDVGVPEGSIMWRTSVDNGAADENVAEERESAYREAKARQMLDDAKIWISQDGARGRRQAEHRLKRLRRKWLDTNAGQEATEMQINRDYFNPRPF